MKTTHTFDSNTFSQLKKIPVGISKPKQRSKSIELILEKFIFSSRWLLTPFYLCLIVVIVLLFVDFFREFVELIPLAFQPQVDSAMIVATLNIIDLLLLANLLLIIVHSGYESFISKLDLDEQVERPEWMSKVSYSSMKLKVIASIVTISAIELLESFINISKLSNQQLFWQVSIHMTFVISGLLFVVTDKMMERKS